MSDEFLISKAVELVKVYRGHGISVDDAVKHVCLSLRMSKGTAATVKARYESESHKTQRVIGCTCDHCKDQKGKEG